MIKLYHANHTDTGTKRQPPRQESKREEDWLKKSRQKKCGGVEVGRKKNTGRERRKRTLFIPIKGGLLSIGGKSLPPCTEKREK